MQTNSLLHKSTQDTLYYNSLFGYKKKYLKITSKKCLYCLVKAKILFIDLDNSKRFIIIVIKLSLCTVHACPEKALRTAIFNVFQSG